MPKLELTAAEKNISRVAGTVLGVAVLAAVLWLNRPLTLPPTMGTAAAVSVASWDGVYLRDDSSPLLVKAGDLRAGGRSRHGMVAIESTLDRPVEVGFRLDKASRIAARGNPAARAVRLELGRGGRLGRGGLASFAGPPARTVRLEPHGSLEVPAKAWIPARFGYEAVGLTLDLTLRPSVVGEAG